MKSFFSSIFTYLFLIVIFSIKFLHYSYATEIDHVSTLIDNIENGKTSHYELQLEKQKVNNKPTNFSVKEKYAGMIGDKKKSKGLNLDLMLKNLSDDTGLLVIQGRNIENEKIVQTKLVKVESKNRFFIDVYFNYGNYEAHTVNFTYQMPNNIRLKYGQQFFGYRIAIDFPYETKILIQERRKKQIIVKFKYKSNKTDKTIIDKKDNNIDRKKQGTIAQEKEKNNIVKFNKITINHKPPIVIVIDAGHGGIDAGAISNTKKKEKDITLMYANRLEKYLVQSGFKVVMTRQTDMTLSLINRVKIAKNHNADVYISLHTDSCENKKISGTTVYRLSELNNNWRLFYNKNYLPTNYLNYFGNSSILDMLIEMSHAAISEKTSMIVDNVISSFKSEKVCNVCKKGQRAFAVLKGLHMMSILIEIGYISNIDEEKKIISQDYIDKFCKTLADTLKNSFTTL